MVSQITLTGMVMISTPVNDYDKRLVILTKERGRVTVFAKGARRPNSQFIAGSRPFSFGSFYVYPTKNAYNLISLDIKKYFDEMTQDIEKVYLGTYFMELADYFSRENVESKDMLNLIYISFNAVLKGRINSELIRFIYELKIFTINGEYPDFFSCNKCGGKEKLNNFSRRNNSIFCDECALKLGDGFIKLSESAVYTFQYVISADILSLYSFEIKDDVLEECKRIMKWWIKENTDKEFKSLIFL